jgi:hypothetical protein
MAILMTDEELLKALRQLAEHGALVNTGWVGFQALMEYRAGQEVSAEETETMRLAFWAGARCVFDALHRLDGLKLDAQWLAKLMTELGADPFCRPPPQGRTY